MKSNEKSLDKVTMSSLIVALGIIYGDIGTSPLYVLKAIVGDRPINDRSAVDAFPGIEGQEKV